MKTFNKVLLGMAAVTTVLAPLAPKSFSVNINLDQQPPEYISADTQCNLTYTTITSRGVQICEYHCQTSNKTSAFKTFAANNTGCPATTTEKLKDYH